MLNDFAAALVLVQLRTRVLNLVLLLVDLLNLPGSIWILNLVSTAVDLPECTGTYRYPDTAVAPTGTKFSCIHTHGYSTVD